MRKIDRYGEDELYIASEEDKEKLRNEKLRKIKEYQKNLNPYSSKYEIRE